MNRRAFPKITYRKRRAMSKDKLRIRAQKLLALALRARDWGELELADELTARAMRLFDEANGFTDAPESPGVPTPPTSTVAQQQQQQQKRIEPKKDGEEE
jgi:hypothetical protein